MPSAQFNALRMEQAKNKEKPRPTGQPEPEEN